MDAVAEFFSQADVERVMTNSRVSTEAKLRVADSVLGKLPPLVRNLVGLLITKGRTTLAAAIARQFREMVEESQGIARARATSAVPLSPEEQEAITRRLSLETGKQVILETSVDPELLGGLVVQIGDRLIDGSTRARLTALRENLVGAIG